MASNYEQTGGMLNRRNFFKSTSLAIGACGLASHGFIEGWAEAAPGEQAGGLTAADLPKGSAPKPVAFPHFPDRLHAFVWRNWQLVPARRMAEVVGASAGDIVRLGRSMGLAGPPRITVEQQRRSALTVIRRNWHLLPYEQLLQLLGWTAEQMAFTLREDDFLYVKLGNLKPAASRCDTSLPMPRRGTRARNCRRPARAVSREASAAGTASLRVREGPVAATGPARTPAPQAPAHSRRGICYSFFALYGDPLLDPALDPYPDGYLARLAASGVNGVWLQAVLSKLAPFPWDARQSEGHETRLKNLRLLVERARKHGMGVYLYLNEPRSCPMSFFASRPNLKGVAEGDYAALCTSVPEVREYLASAVETICRAVPGLAGFFTITASENLTNCWSHYRARLSPLRQTRAG